MTKYKYSRKQWLKLEGSLWNTKDEAVKLLPATVPAKECEPTTTDEMVIGWDVGCGRDKSCIVYGRVNKGVIKVTRVEYREPTPPQLPEKLDLTDSTIYNGYNPVVEKLPDMMDRSTCMALAEIQEKFNEVVGYLLSQRVCKEK